MRKLFGTDGIRGKADEAPLDKITMTRLGGALASHIADDKGEEPPRILIGRDTRESGERIERAIVSGLRRAGARCTSVGIIPTPGLAFLTRAEGFDAGLMISASHNPYQDNGVKIFSSSGYKLSDADESALEEMILDRTVRLPEAQSEMPAAAAADEDLVEEYKTFMRGSVGRVPFAGKVVIDCANGAACSIAPSVLEDLGIEAVIINARPDGRNINDGCGSLHTAGLAAAVKKNSADLGIALDGDADRALFVSGDGRVADGDVLIYEAARHLKALGELSKDLVVTTVMSNLWLERSLEAMGVTMIRTQVGDRYVLEEMLRVGAVLGGEQSGHIIFADRATTGDGILTAIRLLEILQIRKESLGDWLSRVEAHPQVLINVPVAERPDLENHPVIGPEARRAEEELAGSGRLVLRYSGTEPLARVMVEATDKNLVDRISRRLASVIRKEIGAS